VRTPAPSASVRDSATNGEVGLIAVLLNLQSASAVAKSTSTPRSTDAIFVRFLDPNPRLTEPIQARPRAFAHPISRIARTDDPHQTAGAAAGGESRLLDSADKRAFYVEKHLTAAQRVEARIEPHPAEQHRMFTNRAR
jgi:hypothetical protein